MRLSCFLTYRHCGLGIKGFAAPQFDSEDVPRTAGSRRLPALAGEKADVNETRLLDRYYFTYENSTVDRGSGPLPSPFPYSIPDKTWSTGLAR